MGNLKIKTIAGARPTNQNILLISTSSGEKVKFRKNKFLQLSCILFLGIWCWTLIDVADLMNWCLENIPVFLLVGFLIYTYRKFQLSDLSYLLILCFLSSHIYGAKFIYAHNPLGELIQENLNTDRNIYDRIVHFLFGLLISYPIREVCMNYLHLSKKISLLLPIMACLALSALYEIIESIFVGLFFPEQGANFLGHQGDEWDAQKDMALATVGAVCFCVLIRFLKTRQTKNRTS